MSTNGNTAEQHLFADQVSYDDRLPFDLDPIESNLSQSQRERLAARNVSVLRAVGVLEEHRSEPEERSGMEGDVARLDLKLNLVIELLGVAINMQRPLPQDHEIRISIKGIRWHCEQPVAQAGDTVMISLFLHACSAQAVQWQASILATEAADDGGYNCWAEFEALPDAMTQYLERLIFRHHRRQIAEERGASPKP